MSMSPFEIRKWEDSNLLIGLNQKEKRELAEKLKNAVIFLQYKRDELNDYVQWTAPLLIKKVYTKIGNDFDVCDIIKEYNQDSWKQVYNYKLEKVSNVEELKEARKELMNDFVKTFN